MFLLQALDALGSTKWKINNVVLDVLERMWKEGGRLADLEDGDDVSKSQLGWSDSRLH